MQDLYIARQPVFDRELKLYGYELLYRQDNVNQFANVQDANQTTSQVIAMGIIEIGLVWLVAHSPTFIYLSLDYLLDKSYSNKQTLWATPSNVTWNLNKPGGMELNLLISQLPNSTNSISMPLPGLIAQ